MTLKDLMAWGGAITTPVAEAATVRCRYRDWRTSVPSPPRRLALAGTVTALVQ